VVGVIPEGAIILAEFGAFLLFFILWSKERAKSRDYATDLSQLIYSKDLNSRDLRRSLRHKEIRKEVEKNYDVLERND